MITVFWVAIFVVNVLIFLVFEFPPTLIITNALIAVSIMFSVVLPLKAPAYYALKDFKKYYWNIDVDLGEPRSEDKLIAPNDSQSSILGKALVFT